MCVPWGHRVIQNIDPALDPPPEGMLLGGLTHMTKMSRVPFSVCVCVYLLCIYVLIPGT